MLYDLTHHGQLYFDDYSSFVESSTSLDLTAHSNSPLTYNPQRTSILRPTFKNVYSPLPPNWNAA